MHLKIPIFGCHENKGPQMPSYNLSDGRKNQMVTLG